MIISLLFGLFNMQVPSKDNFSAVAYFVATESSLEDPLVKRFLKGDDEFRNSRLKLIANVVKGPWIVKKAVGEKAICIIGRALSCKYGVGENFLEVHIDIGSSILANAIVHLAFGYLTNLTVDLAFVIESQTESELPEQILGAIRFSDLNPASASPVEMPSGKNLGVSESSVRTGFWKSVGQSFSHLLHPGAQGSHSNSSASYVNGVVDYERSSEDVTKP